MTNRSPGFQELTTADAVGEELSRALAEMHAARLALREAEHGLWLAQGTVADAEQREQDATFRVRRVFAGALDPTAG